MHRDGSRQLRHATETPGLDALLRDVGEETPDEAHPKTRGRDEVYVEPGATLQPGHQRAGMACGPGRGGPEGRQGLLRIARHSRFARGPKGLAGSSTIETTFILEAWSTAIAIAKSEDS